MPDQFADLPDALVKDLLDLADPISEAVAAQFENLEIRRAEYRRSALRASLILRKADLDVPREPSVSAVDGSYQLHHLIALDLCAAAAIAVEGTSKEAIRHWPEPFHRVVVKTASHATENQLVLRGLTVAMELELSQIAPHDLVLLDGAFGSLIIYLNQGLSNIGDVAPILGSELEQRWMGQQMVTRLIGLLRSEKTVAIPKYTSRNELTIPLKLGEVDTPDGRTVATLLLEPGEYTRPLEVYTEDFHLPGKYCSNQEAVELNGAMRVIYYRPFGWVPALRIELPGPIANSATRLSTALEGVNRQYFNPAVLEPYPLFLADRMVKGLGAGVNVVEQTVTQHIVGRESDTELAILLLQQYRTEGGRGGV